MKKYNKNTYKGVSYKYIIEHLSEHSFCVRRESITRDTFYYQAVADVGEKRYISCHHPINQCVDAQEKYYPKTANDAYRLLVDYLLQDMTIDIDDVDQAVFHYRLTHLPEPEYPYLKSGVIERIFGDELIEHHFSK